MEKIIQINEEQIKNQLGELVRGTVEDTLNSLLDAEADALCGAQKHERTLDRKNYRSGHYQRKFHTKAGEVTLNMPKLNCTPDTGHNEQVDLPGKGVQCLRKRDADTTASSRSVPLAWRRSGKTLRRPLVN